MSVRFNRRTVSFTEEVWNHLTSDILRSKVRVQEAPTDPLNLGSPIPPIWGSISPFIHEFDDAPQPGACIAVRALASMRHWRERRREGVEVREVTKSANPRQWSLQESETSISRRHLKT